ncbi:single-stranded DNA-binding protein [Geofilum sp. OHC36d9]|uniref:single-stranded DNA-binding protein n=1 Tax=Geofilum sp. OHC36d9 TaxID=3458413 RepID=UPI0040344186
MLKMILSGALGADAEVKEVGNSKLIKFSVAVSMDYRDQQGNKVEKTEWVQANMWRGKEQSTKVADYLKKGTKVLLEGVPESDAYKSKEGEVKSYLSVKVRDLELIN